MKYVEKTIITSLPLKIRQGSYLSVFLHSHSVGKHVLSPLVLSSSGVLTVLSVGNTGLQGITPFLWFGEKCKY